MLAEFKKFVQSEGLFEPSKHRLLLAISGGVDSVVLADLLQKLGVDFALAHCNFGLRGEESDGDEAFVKALAEKLGKPFYHTRFQTEKEAQTRKTSIQIAARELRYAWFEGLLDSEGYDYLVTAHHLSDSIESLLINLTHGCGIRGLHGILPQNSQNRRIRPLLFTTKAAIVEYAQQQGLDYREDSSNATVKYTRNRIRHEVIPQLEKLNPALEQTFADNFKHFREAEWLYDFALEQLKARLLQASELGLWKIAVKELKSLPVAETLLFEILNPYGFTNRQTSQMLAHCDGEGTAQYENEQYRLLRSYGYFILMPLSEKENKQQLVLEALPEPEAPLLLDLAAFHIECTLFNNFDSSTLKSADAKTAFFDAEKLQFPLYLRNWQEGDVFQPLGMGGKHKKLSSLFKDLKLTVPERASQGLLCSGDAIVWVLGLRCDERFSLSKDTKKVLRIRLC